MAIRLFRRKPTLTTHSIHPPAVVLAVLAAGWSAGCQGVNTTQRAEPRARANQIDVEKLHYDGTLNLRAQVVGLQEKTLDNGFLQVQAEIQNRTLDRQIVNYRFDWIDESGIQITTSLSNWKTLSLAAKEFRRITAVAPTPDAVDFRLSLIEPKGTW